MNGNIHRLAMVGCIEDKLFLQIESIQYTHFNLFRKGDCKIEELIDE